MKINKLKVSVYFVLIVLASLAVGRFISADYFSDKITFQASSDADPSSLSLDFGIIGRSLEDRPIKVYCVGMGEPTVIIVGAIHGSEGNTATLVADMARLFAGIKNLPCRFFLIPNLNPDGLLKKSRCNAQGVDLNRNWDTHNWQVQIQGPNEVRGSHGGTEPFSEPETAALSDWLLNLQQGSIKPLIVISYHSAYPPSGLVQPGYRVVNKTLQTDPASALLAQDLARELSYHYSPTFDKYRITGEAINWCADHDILSMDIELPHEGRISSSGVKKHAHSILNSVKRMETVQQ